MIPIYVSAVNPATLKLAGEVADGVILGSCNVDYFRFAYNLIKEGAKEADRDLEKIDIAVWTPFLISKDVCKSRRLIKTQIANMAIWASTILKEAGIEEEKIRTIIEAFRTGKRKAAIDAVTDKMTEALAIFGPIDICIERIQELIDVGATQIIAGPPLGHNVKEAIQIFGNEVIPNLARA